MQPPCFARARAAGSLPRPPGGGKLPGSHRRAASGRAGRDRGAPSGHTRAMAAALRPLSPPRLFGAPVARVRLRTLLLARWLAIAGQAIALLTAKFLPGVDL